MHQFAQLETIFSKKVLQRWHLVNIFLLVISFIVPIFYEAPEEDGLLEGPNSLLTVICSYGLFTLLDIALSISRVFSEGEGLRALLYYFWSLFINIGSISLLIYTGLKSILCFKQWQERFQLRFWLLGLSCLWATAYGWDGREGNHVLWGLKLLVCTIVLAVLWECVNYILYRRKS